MELEEDAMEALMKSGTSSPSQYVQPLQADSQSHHSSPHRHRLVPSSGTSEYSSGSMQSSDNLETAGKRLRFAPGGELAKLHLFESDDEEEETLEQYFVDWSEEDKRLILTLDKPVSCLGHLLIPG